MTMNYVTLTIVVNSLRHEFALFDGDCCDSPGPWGTESMQIIEDQNVNRITLGGGVEGGAGRCALVGAAKRPAGRGRGGGVSSTGGVKIQVSRGGSKCLPNHMKKLTVE